MQSFVYKVINKEGVAEEGERMALDSQTLIRDLKEDGLSVIFVSEKKSQKWYNNITLFAGKVKEQDIINFAKNLGKMIGAGLPVIRALEIMEKQNKKGTLKTVLKNIIDEVSKGVSLSDAIEFYPKVFTPLFVSMARAGEEAGNLADSLQIIGMQMEKTYLLKKKIKGAMMYPAIILCAMVLIAVLMLIFIVPTLTATFESLNVDLPLSTRSIIAVSDFMRNNSLFVLVGAVTAFLGFGYGLRTPKGQRIFDFVLLHTPIIKDLTQQINAARTARTLSSLLSSGVEFTTAVQIAENVIQNSYYKTILHEAGEHIMKGGNISEVFEKHSDLYPLFMSEMSAVGEETGKISEMLLEVAKFYEDDVEQRTKDMSTVIEPFLMIVIGAGVGFFALAMMSPMYSLADKI